MAIRDNVLIDTSKRLFYLSDDVDNESMGKICFNLLNLLQEDDEKDKKEKKYTRDPIKMYINSRGGTLWDMWSLIDIMLDSRTPIYTYCTGCAMSAGFKIFLAGSKRFVSKNATLLYHQGSNTLWGKYMDVVQQKEEFDRAQKSIEEFVISRTKITQSKLDKIRTEKIDWYIHSDEVEKLGIAEVI